eukprot:gene5078-3664_t
MPPKAPPASRHPRTALNELADINSAIHETLRKEQELRSYFQIERDKVNGFWDISKKELSFLKNKLSNAESELEEMELAHQVEMKVYKQKVRHLLYDHRVTVASLKDESEKNLRLLESDHQRTTAEIQSNSQKKVKSIEATKGAHEASIMDQRDSHNYMITVTKKQNHEKEVARLKAYYEAKLNSLREDLELRRRAEVNDTEERHNEHINHLIRQHEQKFEEMKSYYNSITKNNLEIIKSLKDEIATMKKNDEHNESLMYDIEKENHNLVAPLEQAQKDVAELQQKKKQYLLDKQSLSMTKARLRALKADLKKLQEDHLALEEKYKEVHSEREELRTRFEIDLREAMDIVDERNAALQQRLLTASAKVEDRDEQFESVMKAMNMDARTMALVSQEIDQELSYKNQVIKDLHFELRKLEAHTKAVVKEYERRLRAGSTNLLVIYVFSQTGLESFMIRSLLRRNAPFPFHTHTNFFYVVMPFACHTAHHLLFGIPLSYPRVTLSSIIIILILILLLIIFCSRVSRKETERNVATMNKDAHLNVVCVNVKDIMRAAERSVVPEPLPPPRRVRCKNVQLYKGNGYVITGDSRSNPNFPPVSPADGAILEAILGNPAGCPPLPPNNMDTQERHARPPALQQKQRKEEFRVTPPPPKPHEQGHWHDARLSIKGPPRRVPAKKASPVPPPLVIPTIQLASNIRDVKADVAQRSSSDSTEWVDPIQLLSGTASTEDSMTPVSSALQATTTTATTATTTDKAPPELSPVAATILHNTLTFLDRYKPSALQEQDATTAETTTVIESQAPLTSRALSSSRFSSKAQSSRGAFRSQETLSSSSDTDSDSVVEASEKGRGNSPKVFVPRSGTTRYLPVDEPMDWVEPHRVKIKQRLPFQHMLNLPFEVEMKRIAFEHQRHRELNINKFNMKTRRPRYRKARRNLEHYGLSFNPEDSVHHIPGPFKRHVMEKLMYIATTSAREWESANHHDRSTIIAAEMDPSSDSFPLIKNQTKTNNLESRANTNILTKSGDFFFLLVFGYIHVCMMFSEVHFVALTHQTSGRRVRNALQPAMVQNLFLARERSRQRAASQSTRRSISRQQSASRSSGPSGDDRQLFTNCVTQVQRNLKAAGSAPSLLHTLASYYTRVEPYVDQRPFCVSLSFSTFLFHMQMARISTSDIELYIQLVSNILSQLTENQRLHHPFVKMVVHDRIFGLPSPTCSGAPHAVVLTPPPQYRAFRMMAAALIAMEVVPLDIVYQFHERLYQLCNANSPLVSNRALALLIETKKHVQLHEQANELRAVLRNKPTRINVDFLLASYERLKRITSDPSKGPTFIRALCINCSELFLRFRSPIRREYVERYLYPSLCHEDMIQFLEIPETRRHILGMLLRLCNPGLSTSNQYYLCICAVMQHSFDNEVNGALETVDLVNTYMPHAAYFMSALAVDSRMSIPMFAKVIISLSRGAGLAMAGREERDEVAFSLSSNASSVYSVLYTLREVVRSCSTTSSRRSLDMLKALRVAVPPPSIEALGKLSLQVFEFNQEAVLDPALLCAEIAMVLHGDHVEEAVDSSLEYFQHAAHQCRSCGMQNSSLLICPVTHTAHVPGQREAERVLATLSECCGAKRLQEKVIRCLQDPSTHMDRSVHALIYYIVAHAGCYRDSLFNAVQPYIRRTLLTLLNSQTSGYPVSSEQRANVLMLHVKLITLFANSIDPSYFENTLKVFTEIPIENNHDALCLWLMANILIRQSGPNVELLPTDPLENNYCIDYPGIAPASNVTALNAQLVLQLLDKAHSYSAETRKLVGCCVCRLIQDFNMQAPNIVGSLLSSYGMVTPRLTSLAHFALPIGENSTFWSFFQQQMRSSAPARTALMAALAKSVGRRFRIENPSAALAVKHEETSSIFSVMFYETMKRSPAITRVVLYMMSQWLKQNSTPGKFATLMYTCSQLICAVEGRFDGPEAVNKATETLSDQRAFHDASEKAARSIQKLIPRLQKITEVASHTNEAFYYLMRRLRKKVLFTVAKATGEDCTVTDSDEDPEPNLYTHVQEEEQAVPLEELMNAEDDVFLRESPIFGADLPYEGHQNDFRSRHGTALEQKPSIQTVHTTEPKDETEPQHHQEGSRSQSRGVQTTVDGQSSAGEAGDESRTEINRTHIFQESGGPMVQENKTHSLVTSNEKAISAPFEQSVGTSPIQETNDRVESLGGQSPLNNLVDDNTPSWNEPSLLDWGDTAGKAVTEPGQESVAAHIPSAMVLRYLQENQGLDSVRLEMAQLQNPSISGDLYAEQVVPQYTSVPVAVHVQPNNYNEPHIPPSAKADQTVVAPVVLWQTGRPATAEIPMPSYTVPHVEAPVVDGETPIPSMSELNTELGDQKRIRLENMARPVRPVARGMDYFLQQGSSLGLGGLEEAPSSMGPQQVRIPTCFMEQPNDTALRELRQALGPVNPNTAGAARQPSALKDRRRSKGEPERSSSTAWWADMSAVPMPGYATDPQYSMEL